MADTAVLVVGAGPVGLMMACQLLRHGVKCRIIDQHSGPTPLNESRALGIQARTMEVFREMGIADRVLARCRPLRGISAFHGASRVAHLTFDFDGLDTRYPNVYCLPQSETERLLIDRLTDLGGRVERGMAIESLIQDDAGVKAQIKAADGEAREVAADYLVGCDGSRSVVRKALDLKFEGGEYEEAFLIADVKVHWASPVPDDESAFFLTPDGPIVTFPMPEPGRWRLVDTSGFDAGNDPAAIVARFQDLLSRHVSEGTKIEDPSWTSSFHIHRRVVETYRKGRAFVAGDAAHLHSPAGGQGMNTGLQDVHNLAWKIGLVARGRASPALLDSYTAERRVAAVGVLKGSDQITRIVTLRNELAKDVRDKLMGVLAEFEPLRRKAAKEISELAIAYRDSPIVAEDHESFLHALAHLGRGPGVRSLMEFAAGPRPGDRAPDVSLGDDRRLSDFFHPTMHTLLLFEAASPGECEGAAELARASFADLIHPVFVAREAGARSGAVAVDPDGHAHDRFKARAACLYLVRPDGYIGYRALPPVAAGLKAYLDHTFSPTQPGA